MCGLVAILSKQKLSGFMYKDKGIMQQMLIADVFRGADSTGIFAVNKYGNVDMAKEASSSPYFLGKKDVRDILDDMVTKHHVVVGHNRKATMGNTVDENAHPFIEDHIILVHNGTLQNHRKLADTTVDSHAICKSIATDGYKHTLKNIEGAYALIWYDANLKTVFFTRNAERPLSLVQTDDRIYLASEAKMLDWILDRNDIKKYQVENVPVGKVFKFSLETRKLEVESAPKKDKPAPAHNHNKQQAALLSYNQQGSASNSTSNHSQPHLSLVQQSSNNSSTLSLEEWADSYEIGKKIEFIIDDFELYEHGAKLIGTTTDGSNSEVYCWLDKKISVQDLDDLVNSEVVVGKISSVQWSAKKNFLRLNARDPRQSYYVKFKGGQQMSRDEFDGYGGCCYTCGLVIRDADTSDAILTMKNGKFSNCTCGTCIDDFKNTFPHAGRHVC